MKNNIITTEMDGNLFAELRECIKECIRQSIYYCDDIEKISWFKDCTMDEYFYEYQDIYDNNDVKVGEGLDTIAHKFVLNNDTRKDFENAFEQARDNAYEEAVNLAVEEIEDYDAEIEVINIDDSISEQEQELIDNDGFELSTIIARRIDDVCEEIERKGCKKIAVDNDELVEFACDFAEDIYNNNSRNLTVEDIAKYIGATVKVAYQGSENFDYDNRYYKKEE